MYISSKKQDKITFQISFTCFFLHTSNGKLAIKVSYFLLCILKNVTIKLQILFTVFCWKLILHFILLRNSLYRSKRQKYSCSAKTCFSIVWSMKPLSGLSHYMILRYLLSSLFSRVVLPMQTESILPPLGEPTVKRERTTNNVKS